MQNPIWVPFAVALFGSALTAIDARVKSRRRKMVLLYSHHLVAPNHSKIRGLTVTFNDLRLLVPVITESHFPGQTMGSDWTVGSSQTASLVELRPSVLKRKSIAAVGLLCDGQGEVHVYNGLGNIDIDVFETSDFFE